MMTRQELDMTIDWAAAEGWNQGLYDADCLYLMDISNQMAPVSENFNEKI